MSSQFQLMANALRALSIDAVNQASSGHPGMPMGMADIATVLWKQFLKHNPKDPQWWNRDRFILSNGHGSMLQYALLHLTGYDLALEELKNFRQLHSKTPGHPEYGETPGVEATTGQLGQGLANAVGMALAEKILAAEYNQEDFPIIDHFTYVFMGDGCLMEGISHEVCSLAGTWGLGKLIAFWDDNGISIDGDVAGWFTDNTPERFRAYGWQVITQVDGHNPAEITAAIKTAQKETNSPTLICCKTVIGFGSPHRAGTADVHGSPLGAEEARLSKVQLEWPYAAFEIPQEIYAAWNATEVGEQQERQWDKLWHEYQIKYPALAKTLLRRKNHLLPENWLEMMQNLILKTREKPQKMATRKSSQFCLNDLANALPELIGGSADLTGSNGTLWKDASIFSAVNPSGRYIHYGVREFGMSAIMNGVALYGGFIPFGGTFLTFSDYARNAVRMAAMMKQKVIFVYTHDSIGLGEDGPTHQSIEHTASLRLIPFLHVWRPCDITETAIAWQSAIEYSAPTALLLTRQDVAFQARTDEQAKNISRGGYVLLEPSDQLRGIILATGSEVEIAMNVAKKLSGIRVVSMPCVEIFLKQPADYQNKVLPAEIINRVAIEAGVPDTWYRFVGTQGKVLGIERFGLSAPAEKIYEYFGLTENNLAVSCDDFQSS
ncbi:MAG: transketolase [Gammaproteobacteria bacterium]|nr:transketolase [Gammaproteobacteria bacterium]